MPAPTFHIIMRVSCYLPLRIVKLSSSKWLVVSRHFPKLHIMGDTAEQAFKEAGELVFAGVNELLSFRRLPPGLGEPLEVGEVPLRIPLTVACKLALLQALTDAGAKTNDDAAKLLCIGDKHLRTLLHRLRPTKISNIEEQLAKIGVKLTLGFETRGHDNAALSMPTATQENLMVNS